jgi:hypothetical protein
MNYECSKCKKIINNKDPLRLIKNNNSYYLFCSDCVVLKYNVIYQSLICMTKEINEMRKQFESDFNLFDDNDIKEEMKEQYNNINNNFRDILNNIRSLKCMII